MKFTQWVLLMPGDSKARTKGRQDRNNKLLFQEESETQCKSEVFQINLQIKENDKIADSERTSLSSVQLKPVANSDEFKKKCSFCRTTSQHKITDCKNFLKVGVQQR
jgi:hypothetical protein